MRKSARFRELDQNISEQMLAFAEALRHHVIDEFIGHLMHKAFGRTANEKAIFPEDRFEKIRIRPVDPPRITIDPLDNLLPVEKLPQTADLLLAQSVRHPESLLHPWAAASAGSLPTKANT